MTPEAKQALNNLLRQIAIAAGLAADGYGQISPNRACREIATDIKKFYREHPDAFERKP